MDEVPCNSSRPVRPGDTGQFAPGSHSLVTLFRTLIGRNRNAACSQLQWTNVQCAAGAAIRSTEPGIRKLPFSLSPFDLVVDATFA